MKIFKLLSLALLIGFSACNKEDNPNFVPDQVQTSITEMLNTHMTAYLEKHTGYPGGIAMQVLVHGQPYFAASNFDYPVDAGFHFRAASNTKTFTAAAVLLLHQQGKLNIDHLLTDTIPGTDQLYLPNTAAYAIPYKDEIKIVDVLRHRAGIFDVTNDVIPDTVSADVPYKGQYYLEYVMEQRPDYTFTPEELISVAAITSLSYFEPGTDYHYSNTGYSVLARIIERVSGLSYQDFIVQHIVLPMGLTSTTVPVLGNDQQMPEPYFPGYVFAANEVVDVTESNISGNVAEGNIITTPRDLSVFIRKLLRGEGPLSSSTVNSVMMNVIPSNTTTNNAYGCGLTLTNGLGYGHNGAHEGYLSLMTYDPENDISIVVVTNTWNLSNDMASLFEQLGGLLVDVAYKARSIVKEGS
ncbi:MAG: serine hydrolase [Bacteroidales bacterium]|nr:serine hydrolase [Bacteroidales bacterium]HOI32241.1 serine hydrolase domain-containing protein [Bacteroidales bacterium]